jgi:hypothetical protein
VLKLFFFIGGKERSHSHFPRFFLCIFWPENQKKCFFVADVVIVLVCHWWSHTQGTNAQTKPLVHKSLIRHGVESEAPIKPTE